MYIHSAPVALRRRYHSLSGKAHAQARPGLHCHKSSVFKRIITIFQQNSHHFSIEKVIISL